MKLFAKEKSIYLAKYATSTIIYWIIYFILVSIITFFHFRLGHKLIIVENWLYDFSWQVLVTARVLGYLVSIYFFSDMKFRDIKGQLSFDWYNSVNVPTYLISLGTLIVFIFFSRPSHMENVQFSYWQLIVHNVLIFAFFFFEFLNSKIFLKSRRVGKGFHILTEGSLLYLSLFVLFPRNTSLEIGHMFLFFLAYTHLYLFNYSVLKGMIFISVVFVPLFAFLGHDPLWGTYYSIFFSKLGNLLVPAISLLIVTSAYSYILKKQGEV